MAKEINPDSVLCSPPGPFPATRWFDMSDEYGFNLGPDYIRDIMEYEYILYKPFKMWKEINVSLDGNSIKELLRQSGDMSNGFEQSGFTTDVTDEHFLLLRNAGYEGAEGVEKFKRETLLDILSCNYDFTNGIYEKVNAVSKQIAQSNLR